MDPGALAGSLVSLGLNGTEILTLFTPKGAVLGTGLKNVIAQLNTLGLPSPLPPQLVQPVVQVLPGLFGGYPQHVDIAPAILFIVLFGVLGVASLFVFLKDMSRGHRYWLSFGTFAYCMLKIIGFATRIYWAGYTLRLNAGLVSVIFVQVSPLWLNAYTVIMGHRIFTWRHPETGASKFFTFFSTQVYFLVFGIIICAILGEGLPYLYFYAPHHLHMCHQVAQAAGIFELIYCVLGMTYILLAYVFKPGTLNHNIFRLPKHDSERPLPLTIQPTWIEKTSIFYYPRKGSQTVLYRQDAAGSAIRIINTREDPAGGKSVPQNGDHSHGPSIKGLIFHTVLVSLGRLVGVCLRVSSVFMYNRMRGGFGVPYGSWVFRGYPLYIFYGGVEVLIVVYMLVLRFDLLYYIPDMAKRGANPNGDPEGAVTAGEEEPKISIEHNGSLKTDAIH